MKFHDQKEMELMKSIETEGWVSGGTGGKKKVRRLEGGEKAGLRDGEIFRFGIWDCGKERGLEVGKMRR